MNQRHKTGSLIAENAVVLMVIFLLLFFPLINLATYSYRFNMLCGAAKGAAHAASSATTFTGNAATSPGVVQTVTQFVDNYLKDAKGITNVVVQCRINERPINQTGTITNHAWGTKLTGPAQQDNLYSVEVVVSADVAPLVNVSALGMIPPIAGLTGPTQQSASAQQLIENPTGLND